MSEQFRFLANENFPASAVRWLRDEGHTIIFAAETYAGADDETILEAARSADAILLTFDRDFGEMVFRQRQQPAAGIVLFRLRQQGPEVVLPFIRTFFASEPALRGFFTVASPGYFRQTPLPSASG